MLVKMTLFTNGFQRGWLKLDGRSVLIADVDRLSKRSR
jgi:hypothetical protein